MFLIIFLCRICTWIGRWCIRFAGFGVLFFDIFVVLLRWFVWFLLLLLRWNRCPIENKGRYKQCKETLNFKIEKDYGKRLKQDELLLAGGFCSSWSTFLSRNFTGTGLVFSLFLREILFEWVSFHLQGWCHEIRDQVWRYLFSPPTKRAILIP